MRLTTTALTTLLFLRLVTGPAFAADRDLAGSWAGSFDIHFADGRVINDTALLQLQQSGATLTGTVGPRADAQAPIRDVATRANEIRFVADSTPGKTLRFVLALDGDQLTGEARGEIGEDSVRVVIRTTRASGAAALTPDALYQKVLALDTAMFDSFNRCSEPAELARHAAFFDESVEFYHDLGGLTQGVQALLANTRKNVCGKFRRELDRASFRVYPIPGYGALAIGTHRFCHTPTTCEGAGEFSTLWRERNGVWQITRALSFAHRSLN